MDHFQLLLASCSDYKPVETWRIQLLGTVQAVFYDRKHIFIYDSLNRKTLHNQHKQFLEKLFPTYNFDNNSVKFPEVHRQSNYNDCGIFAIVFATSLLFNVQKVFPLAVVRAKEADADRKRIMQKNNIPLTQSATKEVTEELINTQIEKNNKCYIHQENLDRNRAKRRHQYAQNLQNNRTKKRYQYQQSLENNLAKKRRRYEHNLENNRAIKRRRYEDDLENNRAKKRTRYLTNIHHERNRQKEVNCSRKWLYNKRYYEKKKAMSSLVKRNRNIGKNIIKKYKKFWSRNYIKYYNPVAIENIFNKLDIKNNVEKQLEAEKIVRRCMQIRNTYVRDMYKILALLKKKSEVCLILATKCKTIDEKLTAFCGKSKHTASSENYFIDGTYRNIFSSQVLAMNMEGQVTNVLPLKEAQAKKSWLRDDNLCKIDDPFLINCYEKVLQTISICIFKKIPELLQKIHKCTIKTNSNTKLQARCLFLSTYYHLIFRRLEILNV
ncbi:hypothetical protein ALC57_10130 [Trachymyrmex cornetzi]|uniref:Ubiquitin-like protease family profile domain-containing protein n=1 Tax=Trachymyrmex cornetzi TaxID=471704 RepID=A0A151J4L6_9HYME|nr:hypothetical protein ALC57_10130 [Trachymyrmex cornetzi]